MTSRGTIDILLATYNGDRFLPDLFASLMNQTCRDWRLLVHDDGSGDGTVALIQAFVRDHPGRAVFFDDGIVAKGAAKNFAHLLARSTARYAMFCDQDDVWLPDKIAMTFARMREVENTCPGMPVLVHTDLCVVDERLGIIAPSLWAYQRFDPEIGSHARLLAVQNVVTGCTVMINREARELSLPIPEEAVMHDWWMAILVARYGMVAFVHQPTILYRQHGTNSIGARKTSVTELFVRLTRPTRLFREMRSIHAMVRRLPFHVSLFSLMTNKFALVLARYLKPSDTFRKPAA